MLESLVQHEGNDTADAALPKTLVRDLAALPSLMNQLCRRQDSMESRIEIVFTRALDVFFKRLEEPPQHWSASKSWMQCDIRKGGFLDDSLITDDSSHCTSRGFVTPRTDINVNRVVFQAMKAVKNPVAAVKNPVAASDPVCEYTDSRAHEAACDSPPSSPGKRKHERFLLASDGIEHSCDKFAYCGMTTSEKSDIIWRCTDKAKWQKHGSAEGGQIVTNSISAGLDRLRNSRVNEIKEAIEGLKHPQIEISRPSIRIYGDTTSGYKEPLAKIVKHPFFDSLCAGVILLNSVLIGSVTERLTVEDDEAIWMKVCAHLCNAFFFVELVLRMLLNGCQYFIGPDRLWNIFDFTLVAFAVLEVFMDILDQDSGASLGSGLKTIKMVRIIRIFRVFRFFRNLAILAVMIADSMKELMWALVMLSIIIYVFAIFFVSGCTGFIKDGPEKSGLSQSTLSEIHDKFGSVPRAVESLILSMLGGISWGEVSGPLTHTGWVMPGAFFFYIFFTMLAVLNIITGVFVDNAVETAKHQREFLIQKEMELKDKFLDEMRQLFTAMDVDGSGTLSIDELRSFFEDKQVSSYFQVLGMDPYDIERLFRLIDEDGSGEVEIQEFLDGCIRLKGEARSIDVHALLYETKAIYRTLSKMADPNRSSLKLRTNGAHGILRENGGKSPEAAAVSMNDSTSVHSMLNGS